jgi:hypothetical protein
MVSLRRPTSRPFDFGLSVYARIRQLPRAILVVLVRSANTGVATNRSVGTGQKECRGVGH